MYRGFVLAAADEGSTPSLGPFAVCHSPSLSPCFLSKSSAVPSIKPKGPKILKERNLYYCIVKLFSCHLSDFLLFFLIVLNPISPFHFKSLVTSRVDPLFVLSHFLMIKFVSWQKIKKEYSKNSFKECSFMHY